MCVVDACSGVVCGIGGGVACGDSVSDCFFRAGVEAVVGVLAVIGVGLEAVVFPSDAGISVFFPACMRWPETERVGVAALLPASTTR